MPHRLQQRRLHRQRRLRGLWWALLALLVAGAATATLAGDYPLPWLSLLDPHSPGWQVLTTLRWPRLLGALVVGGALALSGALLQVLLRNPVADAGLLGITPAAAGAAVLWLSLAGGSAIGPLLLPLMAGLGAVAMTLSLMAAALRGGVGNGERLVLIGVAAGALFSGLTAFLLYRLDDLTLRQVQFWLLGSVAQISLLQALLAAVPLLLLGLWLWRRAAAIDALLLGVVEARLAGVPVVRLQRQLLLAAALLAAIAVVLAGGIAFVGLLVPHLLRRLGCDRHRQLLPLTLVGGGVLLLWADQGVRLLAGAPVPLGVITMILGAPALLLLLWRRGPLQ